MIIDISRGSGGKATSDLIEKVFRKHFSNPVLDKMEDSAIVDLTGGKVAFTTDSYVVTPIFFPGGDIGKLAVCGTVNDLLVMGACPKCISAGFIIENGADDGDLEKIAISMSSAAEEAKVIIAAADTKVIEGNGGIYINTSGIGIIPDGRNIGTDSIAKGDSIIVSGDLGDHHAAILSSRMNIENDIISDCRPLNEPISALFEAGIRVKCMRDITRGGLGTILNELVGASGSMAEIEEVRIPVSRKVRGFCEVLGLDPVYMGNEGKFILIVDKRDEDDAVRILKNCGYSSEARIIGRIKAGSGVVMITSLKGRRIVGPMIGEGLPRIC